MHSYFQRFHAMDRMIDRPIDKDCSIIIVIPVFNEPEVLNALHALELCRMPVGTVEIIAVINAPLYAEEHIYVQNRISEDQIQDWAEHIDLDWLRVHVLHFDDLNPKKAGVGLARKIGMDEAARRFFDIDRNGTIACYDADSDCQDNYLICLEEYFKIHPDMDAVSIYFEHPLEGDLPVSNYEAIYEYELHLRYFIQAQKWVGLPYAYHTIGSSMAVRSVAYMEQGGMNTRQAGEDFYFLHKFSKVGRLGRLSRTIVYPSPRTSGRVPFGTGKAIGEILQGSPQMSYSLRSFNLIKNFIEHLDAFLESGDIELIPTEIREFFLGLKIQERRGEICRNSKSPEGRKKRFFRWFDAFMLMKLLHWMRERGFEDEPVRHMASELLKMEVEDVDDLLKAYRRLQQQ